MKPAAGNPFAPRDYGQLEPVNGRVAIWRNIVNSAIFIGDKGIAVVDTQVNHALARRLLEKIQTTYAKPVLYAINTHYHWDHTNGNVVFKNVGATLLAGKRTADFMVSRAPRQKGFLSSRGFDLGPDPLLPDAFTDDLRSIDLGGLKLEFHSGHCAETTDPTLVWCPGEKVLVSGDTVMTGSFPIFGQPSQDEGLQDDGWLKAIAQLRAFSPDQILPGHGPIAREPELQLLERICRHFLVEVRRHHQLGHTLSETIAEMEDAMPAWITRIPVVWGTPRYAILRVWAGLDNLGQPGWQHVKPTAIPSNDAEAAKRKPASKEWANWQDAIQHTLEGGDAGTAVSLARAATTQFPDNADTWTTLASALIAGSRGVESVLEKGDCFDAAHKAIDRALALRKQHGPALLQRGQFFVMMAYRNGDDPGKGETLLEQAAADPALSKRQLSEIAFYRGIAARARGDENLAKLRFTEALGIDPTYRPALLASMG
jgi:cyclase